MVAKDIRWIRLLDPENHNISWANHISHTNPGKRDKSDPSFKRQWSRLFHCAALAGRVPRDPRRARPSSSCVTAPQSAGKRPTSRCDVATRFRQVALGQTDRAVVLAGRHVQHHQVERPLVSCKAAGCHRVAPGNSPSSPLCPPGHEPVAGPPSLCRRGSRSRLHLLA